MTLHFVADTQSGVALTIVVIQPRVCRVAPLTDMGQITSVFQCAILSSSSG